MPQDPSAARMMSTLQNDDNPVSQQFMSSGVGTDSVQSPAQPSGTDDSQAQEPEVSPTVVSQDSQNFSTSDISDQEKLALFEQVLQKVESAPQEQPQPTGSTSKENIEVSPQVAPQELPGGMQYVESAEVAPEIPLEVENYLQHVEEKQHQMPEEIVEAAKQFQADSTPAVPTQPVKVLPVTKEVVETGKKKNTTFAVRWLVEFSNKMSHLFAGKSIYRTD